MALEVGQVFYLPCLTCVEKGRLKYFVVALTWPTLHFFLINSARSPFAASKPTIARTQVSILQAEHPGFLVHDSWLDCSITKQDYSADELSEIVEHDASLFHGSVSDACRAGVRGAITDNKLLPRELLIPLRDAWK